MKQSELKEQFISDLRANGYQVDNSQVVKTVGIFSVIIHLSTRPSVLIETAGIGKHFIIIHRRSFGSYSDANAETIYKEFEKMVSMCNNFYTNH